MTHTERAALLPVRCKVCGAENDAEGNAWCSRNDTCPWWPLPRALKEQSAAKEVRHPFIWRAPATDVSDDEIRRALNSSPCNWVALVEKADYGALRAAAEALQRERDELKHDIARHVSIASREAERAEAAEREREHAESGLHAMVNANEELRAQLAALRAALLNLHMCVKRLSSQFDKPVTNENMMEWLALSQAQEQAEKALGLDDAARKGLP